MSRPQQIRSPVRCVLTITFCGAISFWFFNAAQAELVVGGNNGSLRVDFQRDVRPILSSKCFLCHGFDSEARQSELRLDEPTAAFADRGGYAAIVPGDAGASEAWRRINSEDEAHRMPPPDSHILLSSTEKNILQRWIEQGADYSRHWSFVTPQRPPLPTVKHDDWLRNEIDRFVLAQLEARGLQPSADADRRTLARRLSLDLTGLPPSVSQVRDFAKADDPEAYERLVDELLASPHFGERLALDWLDAARYADTNGYSIDGGRRNWLWRDWVIESLINNLPYDQFLCEQIAGDLMPKATEAQLIATGFQRNNMVTHEGGTIPEENLTNYNADRVKTLGEAVLGLTLGCAQCHDHKYDPITQRDYYRLFAYFNTTGDIGLDGNGGINPRPVLEAKTVLPNDEIPELKRRIAQLRARLRHPSADEVSAWESQQRQLLAQRGKQFQIHPLKLLGLSTPNSGAGFQIDGQDVSISQGAGLAAYDVVAQLPETDQPISGLRVTFFADEAAPGGGWGFGKELPDDSRGETTAESDQANQQGTFVVTALSASADKSPGSQVNLGRLLEIHRVTASSWRDRYRPENVLDPRNGNGWSPDITKGSDVRLTATFAEPLDSSLTPYITVQVNFGAGKRLIATRFRIEVFEGVDSESALPEDIIAILRKSATQRSDAQQQRLCRYFSEHAAATESLRIQLANLEERLEVSTEAFPTMVMNVSGKPRATYILQRGNYAQPGEEVAPGVPESLPPLPEAALSNRLGLAQWITMPEHPLTARVAVNRIWQIFFGRGIVGTPADFGAQGDWPSHPELLDWLAVDFVESGWNVKRLVRKIVLSSTYRQTSVAGGDLLERDPDNRWLARGPRFRLPAEFIRDNALSVSGLLIPWIGGPSVNPYAPGDLWREVSHYGSTPATAQTFVQDHGQKLYRRSLYTYWKRTSPPPNMTAFDAPNRETCVVQRGSTVTPLQSLVLLNDVQFVEAARAFAERILRSASSDRSRLEFAFEACLARIPIADEYALLFGALARERTRYAHEPARAAAFLSTGEAPRDESIPVIEHAAWSQVAALIMNLSETVTRN